jgi:5-methyltetrahydropteroyltriglutamate--homocysteine methyltransferase
LRRAYTRLTALPTRPNLLVAGYFGRLDLVSAPGTTDEIATTAGLRDKTVVAGVVDGRNIWRTDLAAALSTCAILLGSVGELAVATSCSLLHVPYDLDAETGLDPALTERLAFARQKVDEVVLLGRALREQTAEVTTSLPRARRATAAAPRDDRVRARLAALRPEHHRRTP